MGKIGVTARSVLEYINERKYVTNDELKTKFGNDVFGSVVTLEAQDLIYSKNSSDEVFDYHITPMGKDYLERAATEDDKDQQLTQHFQNVKRIDRNVEDLNLKIVRLENQLEEERRRAEKAERNSWKISLFITLTGALFSAIFSVIAGIFFN